MIKKQVEVVYEIFCDECGVKLGEIRPVDNHIPKREDVMKFFKLTHTQEGKDVCSSCYWKNFDFDKHCKTATTINNKGDKIKWQE